MLKKINIMIIMFPVIGVFCMFVLLYLVGTQLATDESYSEGTNKAARNYHILEDFTEIVRIIVIAAFQYYAHVPLPDFVSECTEPIYDNCCDCSGSNKTLAIAIELKSSRGDDTSKFSPMDCTANKFGSVDEQENQNRRKVPLPPHKRNASEAID
mmetsp:Transcript_6020/g.12069  ORF Transcript_6020/g.12069 Transcript_6020/m.12069 type:complete len:155 (+) Transcript_6020:1371-1835(+)